MRLTRWPSRPRDPQPLTRLPAHHTRGRDSALLVIERRFTLAKGQLFALYCASYTAGRFVWEEMRIDPAHTIGPLRINAWVSLIVFAGAWGWFAWLGKSRDRVNEERRT